MIWAKKTLGDIYEIEGGNVQTGPFGSQLHESDYVDNGIPVIMPKDIVNDKLNFSSTAKIKKEDANRLKKHIVEIDDIVFPRRGEIDKRILIDEFSEGAFCGTGCIRLRGNGSVLFPKYLFYYSKQVSVVKWIENQAIGATMMNLNTSILKSVPIYYPDDIKLQQKITSILSAYDDLIENNNQRIGLLEEMASEIYKEWFVRLRFPGYENAVFRDKDGKEVDRESDGALPNGWRKGEIQDFFKTSSGGTPSRKKPEFYIKGTHNWVKTKELLGSFIFSTEEKITDEAIKKSSAKIFPPNTVLIGMYGGVHGEGRKSTLGQVGILTEPSSTNQACCAFLPITKKSYSYPYVFLFLKTKQSIFLNMSMGAAQQNISQDIIKNSTYTQPKSNVLENFDKLVKPFFEEIKILLQKNQVLQETRDLLLPRLISGKLSVEHLLNETYEPKEAIRTAAEPAAVYETKSIK